MRKWLSAALLVVALTPAAAQAQTEEESQRLGLVSLQWQDEALNADDPTHWPRMVEIANSYGFMTEVNPSIAYEAVYAMNLKPTKERIYLVRQGGIDCRSLDARYEAALRMKWAFQAVSYLYAGGAVVAGSAGLVVPHLGVPLAGVLTVGAVIGNWAAWRADRWAYTISTERQRVRCTKGGIPEWLRPVSRTLQARLDMSLPPRQRWSYGA